MKAIVTSKRFISVLALMLAIVMCFSACGSDADTSSTPSEESVTEASGENKTDESSSTNDSSDVSSEVSSEASSSGDSSTTTSSDTPSNTTSVDKPSSSSEVSSTASVVAPASSTEWADDYLATMPESVKEKGVTILMWREMHPTEQKLLDDFVNKTGCKVTKIQTTEQEYSTKLVSLISAKESPDICALQTENFPGIVTKAMQPLDEEVFRLDDDAWYKDYMDVYSINDKYFSVAMNGSWSCEDCLYVTYYQPKVLKACGVSTTPWQLYKQGKWNWAAQKDIAQKVSAANKGYTGISLQSFDLYMLSVGEDFVTYDGKQFTNKLGGVKGSSMLTKAWQEVAVLNELKLSTSWNVSSVLQGKIGLFTSIAYGMYDEGDWGFENIPGGFASLECVPVAGYSQSSATTPSRPKTWGVPKGAKNPEGAAYFLRYWLDVENCDFDKTFINSQAKEVFEIVSSKSHKKTYRVGAGVTDYVTAGNYGDICKALNTSTSANVTTVLNSKSGQVNTGVNRANRDLKRIK